ncbi:hypothetical protein DTO271G3_4041 [Paecilomyces variotii]|nr:hypothetical protein DTO271G3_4041 [Paecilomyces variotii]
MHTPISTKVQIRGLLVADPRNDLISLPGLQLVYNKLILGKNHTGKLIDGLESKFNEKSSFNSSRSPGTKNSGTSWSLCVLKRDAIPILLSGEK